jgi:hypothetical protein
MMKQRAILLVFVMLTAIGAVVTMEFPAAIASSHREAPAILSSPQVDATDFYMFRSYEAGREGFVTLIADYLPLQDAYGGPNYFSLDPAAAYDIHITNDGNVGEDITFRFQFMTELRSPNIGVGGQSVDIPVLNTGPFGALPLGEGALTQRSTYELRLIRGSVDSPDSEEFVTNRVGGANRFGMPFDNIGQKSISDYEAYANGFIHNIDIPGCGPGKVFAGQRREPFAVNLGEVFDLINLNPIGNPDAERSDTADKNITSLILEVPIDCLTGDGSGIIGGWTTARLPRNRMLTDDPTFDNPDLQSGGFVQVSRLGNPLVNEVAIGLADKNKFNASHPQDDTQFFQYVTNPTLPALIEALFPTVSAPTNVPRDDLVKFWWTGFPGLNEDGSVGELMRLNTSIPPTPQEQQDRLGVIGGDLAGSPNGRRPGDDVVDIKFRVGMGRLCHLAGGSANTFTATLTGPNVVPPANSNRTGNCTGSLTGNQLQVTCNHNLLNVFQGLIQEGAPGVNGPLVCIDTTGPNPVFFNCNLTQAQLDSLQQGNLNVQLHTAAFPGGELRGQLNSPTLGMCSPADALSGLLDFTDGAYQGPDQFDDTFPYLGAPLPGSPNEVSIRFANLTGGNADPPEETDARGGCEGTLNAEHTELRVRCTHNVLNATKFELRLGGPNGTKVFETNQAQSPIDVTIDESNFSGSDFGIFTDGFESGGTSSWSNVAGNPTTIAGPFR